MYSDSRFGLLDWTIRIVIDSKQNKSFKLPRIRSFDLILVQEIGEIYLRVTGIRSDSESPLSADRSKSEENDRSECEIGRTKMLTARSGPLGVGRVPRTLGPAEGSDHLFLLPERALVMDSTHLRQDLAGLDFNLHLNLLHTAPRGNVWLCEFMRFSGVLANIFCLFCYYSCLVKLGLCDVNGFFYPLFFFTPIVNLVSVYVDTLKTT